MFTFFYSIKYVFYSILNMFSLMNKYETPKTLDPAGVLIAWHNFL